MSWLTDIFSKIGKKGNDDKYAYGLGGNAPIFSQFGTNIYASDVVQQAISCIVQEIKKLNPMHIRENGTDVVPVAKSNIQKVLDDPNRLMTTSDFLEKIAWLLFLNYNVFIVPIFYEWKDETGNIKRNYTEFYPINPSQVDFIEDSTGKLFVKFYFKNGQNYILNYSDIIHIKKNFSVNEYLGGNEQGQPDNEALLETLRLNHKLLESISISLSSACSVNGVVKFNTLIDGEKTEKALKELEDKLKNSESGFLPLDLKAEFIPIKKDIKLVDTETLAFLDSKILRNFGVPLCILTGDYTKEQYEAFYQKTIEPIVIELGQAFTKSLFTKREKDFYNKIKFFPKDLIFMSISQTLEMIRLLGDSGALFENEKRVALGLMPLKELEGVRKQSLNYVDVNIANQYQLNNKSKIEKGE